MKLKKTIFSISGKFYFVKSSNFKDISEKVGIPFLFFRGNIIHSIILFFNPDEIFCIHNPIIPVWNRFSHSKYYRKLLGKVYRDLRCKDGMISFIKHALTRCAKLRGYFETDMEYIIPYKKCLPAQVSKPLRVAGESFGFPAVSHLLILDLDESIQHHGPAVVEVNRIRSEVRLLVLRPVSYLPMRSEHWHRRLQWHH